MLLHIVKNGEVVEQILQMYHLEFEELQHANLHISNLRNIQPGMKIKIPLLNEEVEQILEKTETFVQSYYPKIEQTISEVPEPIETKKTLNVVEKQENLEEVEQEKANVRTESPQDKTQIPPQRGIPYPGILPPKFRH